MSEIKSKRIRLGLTQKEVAQKVGVTEATVSRWESGEIANMRRDKIMKLSELLQLPPSVIMDLPEKKQQNANGHPGYIRIPVLGRVAAGIPIEQIEDVEDFEDIRAPEGSEADYFALRIRGDSMQPLIQDGSVVIVHRQPDAETGEIVIATVNGDDATCKRLKKYAEGIMLVSINPAYDPMVFEKGDVNSLPVSILGKVIEVRTTL